MQATKEEIITHLAGAKARFETVIKDEEKSPTNIMSNANIYANSIIEYLETKVDLIRDIIQQITELQDKFAKQETAEIKTGEEPPESPQIKAIVELRSELKKIVEEILEHVKTYYVVLWEYNVRITSKYYILLSILDEISSLPEIQNKLSRQEKIIQRIRFQKLKNEYKEFRIKQEKANFDAIDWIDFIKKTVQPRLGEQSPIGAEKSYEAFAKIVETFVRNHREHMERVGELVEKQTTMRFKKILQMADDLIAKAAA